MLDHSYLLPNISSSNFLSFAVPSDCLCCRQCFSNRLIIARTSVMGTQSEVIGYIFSATGDRLNSLISRLTCSVFIALMTVPYCESSYDLAYSLASSLFWSVLQRLSERLLYTDYSNSHFSLEYGLQGFSDRQLPRFLRYN